VSTKVIRVLDPDGVTAFDISLKRDGQQVPVQNLRACVLDPSSGNMFVSDTDAGTVYCISSQGEVLASSPAGAVTKPFGLSFCARTRRLAVADGKLVRVLRSDNLLPVITLLQSSTNGSNTALLADEVEFKSCCDVAFDLNGFLYVVDSGTNRVVVFDCSYINVTTFGSYGSGDGQFNAAQSVCIDGTGKVFVGDHARVQMFDRQGQHVLSLSPASLDPALSWSQLSCMSTDAKGRLLLCSHGTGSLLRIL
jgi:DNA-binding beta-propeller fold protein YncE